MDGPVYRVTVHPAPPSALSLMPGIHQYPTAEQPAFEAKTAKKQPARLTRGEVFVEGLGRTLRNCKSLLNSLGAGLRFGGFVDAPDDEILFAWR